MELNPDEKRHFGRIMFEAIANDDSALVGEVLKKNPDIVKLNPAGQSWLHFSARDNKGETTRRLVELGIPIDALSEDGETPLHLAALYGNVEIVKWLLENGADVNARSQTNCTPLIMAAKRGQMPVGQVLLSAGADAQVSTTGSIKATALEAALMGGYTAFATLLTNEQQANESVPSNNPDPYETDVRAFFENRLGIARPGVIAGVVPEDSPFAVLVIDSHSNPDRVYLSTIGLAFRNVRYVGGEELSPFELIKAYEGSKMGITPEVLNAEAQILVATARRMEQLGKVSGKQRLSLFLPKIMSGIRELVVDVELSTRSDLVVSDASLVWLRVSIVG